MFGRKKVRDDIAILDVLAGDRAWHYTEDLIKQTSLRSRRFHQAMSRLIETGIVERRFLGYFDRPRKVVYRLKGTR